MKIAKATTRYEAWLARHLRIVDEDLAFKHEQMRSAVFPFLRATYYRWAQIWEEVCGDAASAPKALAVGDLHVENFGTWRDIEGRLIWGINDFDEAWSLPYTNDLITAGNQRAAGPDGVRREVGRGSHPQRISGSARGGRTADRAGGASSRLAPDGYRAAARTGGVLGKAARASGSGRGAAGGRAERDRQTHARKGVALACGASRGRPRQPGPRTLCGDCGVARRVGGARGESAGAFGMRVGGTGQRHGCRSATRKFWIARCAAATRLCVWRSAGSCGGWRRIVRASSSRRCRRSATKPGCCTRWVGRRPTCIWVRPRRASWRPI